jgi:hypothetical protein
MSTWARSALDRSEKLLTLCAPVDADIASRAGSGLTVLTPDDLHTTAPHVELLQRALPDGDRGLGILVWADAVIAATSRETHEEIETTLASLCCDHPVSVLCVYDRNGKRDGAGIEHLDLAVARHPDGLLGQCLALRRAADTLYVDGEIDMSNLDVFAAALRALTDTPAPTDTPTPGVRIDLEGVTFLAAAGVRTLIRDTAPHRYEHEQDQPVIGNRPDPVVGVRNDGQQIGRPLAVCLTASPGRAAVFRGSVREQAVARPDHTTQRRRFGRSGPAAMFDQRTPAYLGRRRPRTRRTPCAPPPPSPRPTCPTTRCSSR